MMRPFTWGCGAAFILSGCVSPGTSWMSGPKDPVYVLVKSDPEGATVTFPDGTTCETPCRLGIIDPVEMTVARIGYAPDVRLITSATASPITVVLEPVGRSTEVEEVGLPDL